MSVKTRSINNWPPKTKVKTGVIRYDLPWQTVVSFLHRECEKASFKVTTTDFASGCYVEAPANSKVQGCVRSFRMGYELSAHEARHQLLALRTALEGLVTYNNQRTDLYDDDNDNTLGRLMDAAQRALMGEKSNWDQACDTVVNDLLTNAQPEQETK